MPNFSQLVKEFPTVYEILKLKKVRHVSVSSARLILSVPSHPIKIHFNNIFLSILRSSSGSGPLTKTLYACLFFPIRATFPFHLVLLDLITRIIFGEVYVQIMELLILIVNFLDN
jgi:hypothetical protein